MLNEVQCHEFDQLMFKRGYGMSHNSFMDIVVEFKGKVIHIAESIEAARPWVKAHYWANH